MQNVLSKFMPSFCALLVVSALATLSFASPIWAQQEGQIRFLHDPPKGSDIALPGSEIPLTLRLSGATTDAFEVVSIVSRDGDLFRYRLENPQINGAYELEFQSEILAPRHSLVYQFVVLQNGKPVASSQLYSVMRQCSFPDESLPLDAAADLSSKSVEELLQIAARFDNELASLDNALRLTTELRDILGDSAQ